VPAQAAEAVDKPALTGQAATPAQPVVNSSAPNLSTAEVNELAKDPAVKAVLEAFGGSIVHYEVGQPMLFAAPPETQSAPAQTPTPHQEPLHEEEDEE
jgi:hypothetical protein